PAQGRRTARRVRPCCPGPGVGCWHPKRRPSLRQPSTINWRDRMNDSAFTTIGLVFGSLLLLPAATSAATSLDAYTLSAGGSSTCVTFGPDPMAAIFGGSIQV